MPLASANTHTATRMTSLDSLLLPVGNINTYISIGTALSALNSFPSLTSMAPTYSGADKDNKLIHELFTISKKNPKLIKSSDYVAPGVPEMTIRSWKMLEHKYYDVPSPFPTLARGLFTTEVDEGRRFPGKDKEHRIVVRGYDKFFNIGEVPWTSVSVAIDLTRDQPRFTDYVTVGFSESAYNPTVHSFPKVKRLHHLHCRSHFDKSLGHFKTFAWTPQ